MHQHVVDAYAAQHASGTTRNITVAFDLIGLYLALEKGYTGKEVQNAHMQIAKIRKDWPRLKLRHGRLRLPFWISSRSRMVLIRMR
jgi:hypothetical protein